MTGKVEAYISQSGGNILALDISQSSTGLALWGGATLQTLSFEVEKPPKDDVFYFYNLAKNFENLLHEIIPPGHYSYVFVEDIFVGQFIQSYQTLAALANGLDMYLHSKAITYNNFYRINNQQWKKELRDFAGLTDIKQMKKDKYEIQKAFEKLEYIDPQKDKNKSGLQDRLDAVGIMIGGLKLVEKDGIKETIKYRVKYEYFDEESYKRLTRDIVEIDMMETNKIITRTDLNKLIKQPDQWYSFKVKSTGALGIRKRFAETLGGPNYLVAMKYI